MASLVLGAPHTARAQAPGEVAAAEALFRDGRTLAAGGRLTEACAKFAESQRLDPGVGTLLVLAQCHEREGRTGSAWLAYLEVAAASERVGRADRVKIARAALARLEPELAYLTVRLDPRAAALPSLEVRRDGAVLGAATYGARAPVDPGGHVVSATAPGRVPWSITVQVSRADRRAVVDVPVLEPEASDARASDAVATPVVGAGSAPADPPATPLARGVPHHAPLGAAKVAGIVALGAGIAAVGAGAYFGLRAASSWSELKSRCEPARCEDLAARPLYDDAAASATASTVLVGGGLAVTGIAAYLLSVASRPSGATVAASWMDGGGRIGVSGRW